jgi:hypothetical protein
VLKASVSTEVDALVRAVAIDSDMTACVLAFCGGEKLHTFGLAKLKVLADESGSIEAKKLLAKVAPR